MTRGRPTPPAKSAVVPDPLAELREPDTQTLPVVEPGQALLLLSEATDLQDAVNLALIQATPENLTPLAAELLEFMRLAGPQFEAHGVPLVTEDAQDDARNQMIQVWHSDTVAVGVVHKGGVCCCRYLATAVLQVIMPAELDDTPEV